MMLKDKSIQQWHFGRGLKTQATLLLNYLEIFYSCTLVKCGTMIYIADMSSSFKVGLASFFCCRCCCCCSWCYRWSESKAWPAYPKNKHSLTRVQKKGKKLPRTCQTQPCCVDDTTENKSERERTNSSQKINYSLLYFYFWQEYLYMLK